MHMGSSVERARERTPAAENVVKPSARLSRFLAFLLRHKPETLDLELDAQGWTSLVDLVLKINKSKRFPQPVTLTDIEALVSGDSRHRFTIRDGKIRANSGHSVEKVSEEPSPVRPPDLLFCGMPEGGRAALVAEGLRPRRRRFLQLTTSPKAAERMAARMHKRRPHVVVIEASRAARGGVTFYRSPNGLYLAEFVPFEFLLSEQKNYIRQVSSGSVLFRGEGAGSEVLLIRSERHGRGVWEIAKGKVEPGETVEEAAIREFCEETGVSVAPSSLRIKAPLRRIRYAFRTEELCFLKTVHFFLVSCSETDLQFCPRTEERIFDCRWFGLDEAADKVAFRNLRPIIRAAKAILDPEGGRGRGQRRRQKRRNQNPPTAVVPPARKPAGAQLGG